MTISATYTPAQANGNDVAVAFPFTFKVFVEADLTVILTDALGVNTTQAITTDYTVSINADQNNNPGGTVTMLTAPATGETLIITRVIEEIQETDIANGGGFYPEVLEDALDRLTMLNQQNTATTNRALVAPLAEASIDTLPSIVDRASKYLAFDADGQPVATSGTANAFIVTGFAETLLDDANAAAMRATIGSTTVGDAVFVAATAAAARATLDSGTVGDAVFLADTAAAARSAIAATGNLISDTTYGVINATPVTLTIASPCVATITFSGSHGLMKNMPIKFATTGALPTGLVAGTTYYWTPTGSVAGSTSLTGNVSATPGGAAIDTTGSQSGTHSISNPTYNKATNNPSFIEIEFLGGGGGGGGVTAVAGAAASGGGAGGFLRATLQSSAIISGDVTLTVGVGGIQGTSSGTDGGAGGDTSATIITGGVTLTAKGGAPGLGSTGANAPKLGGLGGAHTIPAFTSGQNVQLFAVRGNNGGNSVSTAAAATSYSGSGAGSIFGGEVQGNAGASGSGTSAMQSVSYGYGSGGSGALGATALPGGNGGSGCIRIREYA